MSDKTPNPIAALPSGEPIPQSSPPPSAGRKPSVSLGPLLSLKPRDVDAFLTHLNKCLSTPSGIDTVLLFLCYTSRLSSSVLTALSARVLRRSAADWIALVSASRATVVLAAPPERSTKLRAPAAAAASLVLARRLKNLSALLSEARVILRLWGLLGMYFWAKRLLLSQTSFSSDGEKQAGPRPTRLETAVSFAQLATCVAFQALENGAYLSSKGVLGWSPARQNWANKWSARLWGVHVGIELAKLAAERVGGGPPGRGDAAAAARWRSAVVRNLAWAPLTVHWGSDGGLVSDWMVGALASVPGVIQMRELWRETA